MPVISSHGFIGWTGAEGKPVAIAPNKKTPVSDADWAVFKASAEGRRHISNGSVRVESTLTAAIALAVVPAAEILRLADEQDGSPVSEPLPVSHDEPASDSQPESPPELVVSDAVSEAVAPAGDEPASEAPTEPVMDDQSAPAVVVVEPKPAPTSRRRR